MHQDWQSAFMRMNQDAMRQYLGERCGSHFLDD
jgi:hypothetical protein